MRYLRMLTNAAIAGVAGAAYIGVLVLQLNPRLPLYPDELGALLLVLVLTYGLNLAVVFYGLFVLRQLVAAKIVSPGWISLRLLSWCLTGAASAAAALMWVNLRGFGPMLDAETVRRMTIGAAALSVAAFIFLIIAIVHYSFGRPGTFVGAFLLGLTAVASIAVPVTARGPGIRASLESRALGIDPPVIVRSGGARVRMILLDGASLDYISAAAIEGRLPNLGRILDGGAAAHLATLRPTQSNPVWTSMATGKMPAKTGVRSTARYRARFGRELIDLLPDMVFAQGLVQFGILSEVPFTSASVRTRTLWSILSTAGIDVGVVGYPLTHPAQPVRGFLVTDEFYKQDTLSAEPDDPSAVYPPELLNLARIAAASRDDPPEPAGPLVRTTAAGLPPAVLESQSYAADRVYERVARRLDAVMPVRVTAVRYRLLDLAGHDYLRYAMPRAFGDVTDAERRRYGGVLGACYGIIDAIVGETLDTLGPGDLFLVVSGYGMEALEPEKRILERLIGNGQLSGTHEAAPDGFLLAYGDSVAAGRRRGVSLVDLTPTVLYFLGLPIGRDMDGFARTELFDQAFTDQHPVTYIPTHDR